MGKQNKVKHFRISLVDDASHKQIWVRRFTRSSLVWSIIVCLVVFFTLIFSLIAFTPLRTTIPGYPNAQTKRDAIQNAIKIDSLNTLISRWQLYSENLARLGGEARAGLDAAALAGSDSLLRQTVMQEEQFSVSSTAERQLPIEGMHFFAP